MQSPCIHRKAGADLSRCWVPSVSVFTYIDHLQAFEHRACFADKQPAQVGHFCESLPSLHFLAKCRWMWWEMVHEPRQLCSGWHQYCPQTLPPTHLPGSTQGSFPDLHPMDPSVITEGTFLSKAITTSSQRLSLQEPFEQSLLRNRLKNYISLQCKSLSCCHHNALSIRAFFCPPFMRQGTSRRAVLAVEPC